MKGSGRLLREAMLETGFENRICSLNGNDKNLVCHRAHLLVALGNMSCTHVQIEDQPDVLGYPKHCTAERRSSHE